MRVGIAGVVAGPRLGTPATLGVAGVGVGTDFVSLTTLWRAYRRQRYRSWSSADAEGAFCVVCVQFLALCRRWAQQASLLGQVLTAADAENAHSGVGLPACGSLAPLRKVYVVWFRQRTGRLALLRGLYGLFRFWRVGAVRFHSLFQSHTESNRTAPTHQNAKSRFR